MTATQHLSWSHASGYSLIPNPRLAILQNGNGVQIGTDPTGGSFETGTSVADHVHQRAINFGGHQTFIVFHRQSIYRSTDGGATWSTVYGVDGTLTTTSDKIGPILVYRYNGTTEEWEATLVCVTQTTTAGPKTGTYRPRKS